MMKVDRRRAGDGPSDRAARRRNTQRVALALVVAGALLYFPGVRATASREISFVPPDVAPAVVNKAFAEQWRFLKQASEVVPAATTVTVRAADPDMEMSLFMFSLGILVENRILPSSYFGRKRPDGDDAAYVLALAPFVPEEKGLEVVAHFREGSVYRRPYRSR